MVQVGTRSRVIRVSTSAGHVRCPASDGSCTLARPASPVWKGVCGHAAPDAPECAYDQRRRSRCGHRTSCRGSSGSASLPSQRHSLIESSNPGASSPKRCLSIDWIQYRHSLLCDRLWRLESAREIESEPNQTMTINKSTSAAQISRLAFRFVLIVGIANLFADMTYEGARAITGPFLGSLGASATMVGFLVGFGELVGYALRSFSGCFADRSRKYWLFVFVGYAVNMLAVPALALAGSWPVAAAFIILERTGRAIRRPATETMISHAGKSIGRGWVFGLNALHGLWVAPPWAGFMTGQFLPWSFFRWRCK